jgi:hypothetical protein
VASSNADPIMPYFIENSPLVLEIEHGDREADRQKLPIIRN